MAVLREALIQHSCSITPITLANRILETKIETDEGYQRSPPKMLFHDGKIADLSKSRISYLVFLQSCNHL